MEPLLIVTADGSHSLYLTELKEYYHSIHGALTESVHVFLNNGFIFSDKKNLNIMEVGFGTGLNCFLTALMTKKLNRTVTYVAIEKNPINESIHNKLNYSQLAGETSSSVFDDIFFAKWGKFTQITANFTLGKYKADIIKDPVPVNLYFDIVYYDAFSPGIQPEMWTADIFSKIYESTSEGGIFITYCAKGSVRRTLKNIGFYMERLPGPPGKREILRGIKKTTCT